MKIPRNLKQRRQSGNTMIEFALIWSVLWAVFFGVYQFGYAFYIYNNLQAAVANAAELGSKMTYDTGTPSTFTGELQNMVLYGDETAGTSPIVPNLTASQVSVTANPSSYPTTITVSINGYVIDAFFTKFTLQSKPQATVGFYGQVACGGC